MGTWNLVPSVALLGTNMQYGSQAREGQSLPDGLRVYTAHIVAIQKIPARGRSSAQINLLNEISYVWGNFLVFWDQVWLAHDFLLHVHPGCTHVCAQIANCRRGGGLGLYTMNVTRSPVSDLGLGCLTFFSFSTTGSVAASFCLLGFCGVAVILQHF